MGEPCRIRCHYLEIVRGVGPVYLSSCLSPLTGCSYCVYIALLCLYLLLVYLYFPETRFVLTYTPLRISFDQFNPRRLTVEEVSVIFDTGRRGDSAAAAAQFMQTKDVGVVEQDTKPDVSHVETKELTV